MGPTLLKYGQVRHANHKVPDTYTAMEYIMSVILQKIEAPVTGLKDRVYVIQAMTSSGKSTVMPVTFFRFLRNPEFAGRRYFEKSVLCTQPRVITAKDIAENQLAKADYYPDMILNETVGYKTGDFKTERQYHMLLYATIGSFRQLLKFKSDDEIIDTYKFIIIDEAHERSLDTDLTLMDIRYFYERNKTHVDLPFLILTSATIDTKKYAAYFGIGDDNIITVKGATFPIDTVWGNDTRKIKPELTEKILHIHDKAGRDDPPRQNDIMVFVAGNGPFAELKEELERQRKDLLVVFADRKQVQAQSRDYLYVTGKKPIPKDKKRMVIFATNAAETGLTIDSVKYVLDTGWSNTREFYYPHGLSGVIMRPISVSNARQRRGRAGRKFPGAFYPLYSEKTYNAMQTQAYPNIVTEGIENIILELVLSQQVNKLKLDIKPEFRIEDLLLLDLPPIDALLLSLEKAISLGFIAFDAPLPVKRTTVLDRGVEVLDMDAIFDEGDEFGYGITDVGVLAMEFQQFIPGLESAAIIVYSSLFPAIKTQEAIVLAYICSPQNNIKVPEELMPPEFQDLKVTMSCQILETLYGVLYLMSQDNMLPMFEELFEKYIEVADVLPDYEVEFVDAPSFLDLAKDPEAFEAVILAYKRLMAFCLRFNVYVDDGGLHTQRGLDVRTRPPKYFKEANVYLAASTQLKRSFKNVSYDVKPNKLCALPFAEPDTSGFPRSKPERVVVDKLGTEEDPNESLFYLYWKLLEL